MNWQFDIYQQHFLLLDLQYPNTENAAHLYYKELHIFDENHI